MPTSPKPAIATQPAPDRPAARCRAKPPRGRTSQAAPATIALEISAAMIYLTNVSPRHGLTLPAVHRHWPRSYTPAQSTGPRLLYQ
jgi:hypothetical protein